MKTQVTQKVFFLAANIFKYLKRKTADVLIHTYHKRNSHTHTISIGRAVRQRLHFEEGDKTEAKKLPETS